MARYYYMKDGKKEGPIAADDLFYDLRDGHLPPDTQVCADDSATWIPISTLPDSVFSPEVLTEARNIGAQAEAQNQSAARRAKWGCSLLVVAVVVVLLIFGMQTESMYDFGYKKGAELHRTAVDAGRKPTRESGEELANIFLATSMQDFSAENQKSWKNGFIDGYTTQP